jgi:hypothetical protein
MADDRNAFGREFRNRFQASGAVEGVAADHDASVRRAQIVLVGAALAVEEADLDETVAGRLAHLRRPHRLDDRQNVYAGLRGRRRLFERVDKEHRQLPLALERAQVGDRRPIVLR